MEEQAQSQALVKEITGPLYEVRGWMKFLGVVMIVQGIMVALSIIGIVVAWLPIWLGVLLFQSASAAETAQISGNKAQLMESLRKLKMYFIINGVLMLIMLIFVGFSVLFAGAGLFSIMGRY